MTQRIEQIRCACRSLMEQLEHEEHRAPDSPIVLEALHQLQGISAQVREGAMEESHG
jgi:hypothetical protein